MRGLGSIVTLYLLFVLGVVVVAVTSMSIKLLEGEVGGDQGMNRQYRHRLRHPRQHGVVRGVVEVKFRPQESGPSPSSILVDEEKEEEVDDDGEEDMVSSKDSVNEEIVGGTTGDNKDYEGRDVEEVGQGGWKKQQDAIYYYGKLPYGDPQGRLRLIKANKMNMKMKTISSPPADLSPFYYAAGNKEPQVENCLTEDEVQKRAEKLAECLFVQKLSGLLIFSDKPMFCCDVHRGGKKVLDCGRSMGVREQSKMLMILTLVAMGWILFIIWLVKL